MINDNSNIQQRSHIFLFIGICDLSVLQKVQELPMYGFLTRRAKSPT